MKPSRISLFGMSLLILQCTGPGAGEPRPPLTESNVADTSIVSAQEALTEEVMRLPGVVGTAVGLCEQGPCIKVLLARPSPDVVERIPPTYRGFRVDVEVTGEIRARGDTTG